MRPQSRRRGRRAFSLVELMVVIAVVAVLTGLLLPALGHTRRTAQNVVSVANLKQLASALLAYSPEFKDTLVNPFDPAEAAQIAGANTWAFTIGDNFTWSFGDEHYASLMFSPHVAPFLMDYIDRGNLNLRVLFAPADRTVIDRYRKEMPEYEKYGFLGRVGWDSSYWATPALWTRTTIWTGPGPVRIAPELERGPEFWKRNRTDGVVTPQAKVMMWERFDFSRTSRPVPGGGREPLAPNWNNFEASPRVAAMDGSVLPIRIARLRDEAARLEQAGEPLSPIRPCGDWDVPDAVLKRASMNEDNLENGSARNPGKFPAYFWATRNGIAGQDLPR